MHYDSTLKGATFGSVLNVGMVLPRASAAIRCNAGVDIDSVINAVLRSLGDQSTPFIKLNAGC